jgi:hypothetical protein
MYAPRLSHEAMSPDNPNIGFLVNSIEPMIDQVRHRVALS